MPLRMQNLCKMAVPLAVSCHTAPLVTNVVWLFDSADSINLASTNLWQTDLAISLAIEKVVVVVVTTHLEGFLGSGMRLDWENFKEPRFVMASSDKNVSSILEKRTRWGVKGRLVIRVEKRSLKSLVNGRSSSVMRSIFDEVWCMRPWLRSPEAIGAVPTLSGTALGTPLRRCASVVEEIVGGEDGSRETLGRGVAVELAWWDRLPVEVVVRNEGVDVEPMLAKLASAVEVRSRAREAKDRRLLLWERLAE
jgi:hypothetical protein